jgi:hypothetical protein
VTIDGNLSVGTQALVFVLGSLTIRGNLDAGFDYSLIAAHDVSFHSGVSGGEILALDSIVAADKLYLCGNNYSCRARCVRAGTLVDFERGNVFLEVDTGTRVTEWDFAAATRALGLSAKHEGDLRSAWRETLVK